VAVEMTGEMVAETSRLRLGRLGRLDEVTKLLSTLNGFPITLTYKQIQVFLIR
jgi:hypothetical protein